MSTVDSPTAQTVLLTTDRVWLLASWTACLIGAVCLAIGDPVGLWPLAVVSMGVLTLVTAGFDHPRAVQTSAGHFFNLAQSLAGATLVLIPVLRLTF